MKGGSLQKTMVPLLLAGVMANAANKFFVADLEAEAAHGFYADIFEGKGYAPDQYRILPLLGLKAICQILPFHHAVLLFQFVLGALCLALWGHLFRHRGQGFVRAFQIGLAGGYIYLQYTGWRPDTLGLLLPCLVLVWVWRDFQPGPMRDLATLGLILVLAFSRAEIALIFGLYFTFQLKGGYGAKALSLLIPLAAQAALKWWIFPEAQPYTHTIMLWDNFKGYYLIQNPLTLFILSLLVIYGSSFVSFFRSTWYLDRPVWILACAYILLILFVGRLNEYRLYLPLLALFTLTDSARFFPKNEEKARSI